VYDAGLLSRGARIQPYIDGRLDEDELCDISLAAGETGSCPTSYSSEDPCYLQVLAGMAIRVLPIEAGFAVRLDYW